ncbi:MAG: hypothetical protein M1816_003976 [Peltula sp. TS41687]|nr:MAG: hypothetical protein M1816_003976 [Peltula sp. TS41687]
MADTVLTSPGETARDQLDGLPDPGEGTTLSTASGLHEPSSSNGEEDGNHFQKAIAAWRNIGLSRWIPELDKVAADTVTHQRESLLQRKDLAQKTKDFRKLEDAAKLSEIKGLLKAYQSFIDTLTNQSKSTSSAFLQVYSTLSEAPDPHPLLEASVEALAFSEDTLPKLTDENRHLQETVSKLTTQLDETERNLEQESLARKSIEDDQSARIKSIEDSWSAVLEEKKDNWNSKQRSLEEKIEDQERLLKEIKASYEVSQRLDRAENDGRESVHDTATNAELEVVTSELERTSLRLAEVEARNEQLRLELAQVASQSQNLGVASLEDDPDFLRMKSENSSLRRKLDAAKLDIESEKRALESRVRALERDAAHIQEDRDELRKKIQKWNDYDEIKRELEMLKSIEFATGEDEELKDDNHDGVSARLDSGMATQGRAETLEQLLLARNKKLGDELTHLRVSHQDLQRRLASLQEDLSRTRVELDSSRTLTANLENDLLKFQQETSNVLPSSAASVAGTYTSRHPTVAGRRLRTSPTSSIISGFDPFSNPQTFSSDAPRGHEAVGGGSGILPMVTAQRDRFKQRNAKLEEELSKTYQTVTSLRQEIAALQKDNLSLYEKTRYVSSFNRGQGGNESITSSSAYQPNPNSNPVAIQMSSSTPSGLSLDRYRSAYEANISPFAAFRGRESARAYKRMSLPERAVFSVTRIVLANRTSRNLFAAYCLALHLLVVMMIYWMTAVDMERPTSRIGQVALGAAAAAGGPLKKGAEMAGKNGEWQQEGFGGGG